MKKPKIAFLVSVGLAAALSMTNVFATPPNLWWDYVNSTEGNQTECVKKAESVLRQEIAKLDNQKSGKFTADKSSVLFSNDTIRAVVECMTLPDRQMILIITSSNEITVGSSLYEDLKKSLQSN